MNAFQAEHALKNLQCARCGKRVDLVETWQTFESKFIRATCHGETEKIEIPNHEFVAMSLSFEIGRAFENRPKQVKSGEHIQ